MLAKPKQDELGILSFSSVTLSESFSTTQESPLPFWACQLKITGIIFTQLYYISA